MTILLCHLICTCLLRDLDHSIRWAEWALLFRLWTAVSMISWPLHGWRLPMTFQPAFLFFPNDSIRIGWMDFHQKTPLYYNTPKTHGRFWSFDQIQFRAIVRGNEVVHLRPLLILADLEGIVTKRHVCGWFYSRIDSSSSPASGLVRSHVP